MLGFAALAQVALAEIPSQAAVSPPVQPTPTPPTSTQPSPNDFIDYIFQFPDQWTFLRDPVIQQFLPQASATQPGVQLLIYNPVETLQPPVPPIPSTINPPGNSLVLNPQLAVSSVALSGFWALLTLKAVAARSSRLLLEDGTSSLLLEGGAGSLLLEGGLSSGETIPALANHPNIQIVSNRTLMFAQKPSVISTKIDISHINIIINVSGVYVRDGLMM